MAKKKNQGMKTLVLGRLLENETVFNCCSFSNLSICFCSVSEESKTKIK